MRLPRCLVVSTFARSMSLWYATLPKNICRWHVVGPLTGPRRGGQRLHSGSCAGMMYEQRAYCVVSSSHRLTRHGFGFSPARIQNFVSPRARSSRGARSLESVRDRLCLESAGALYVLYVLTRAYVRTYLLSQDTNTNNEESRGVRWAISKPVSVQRGWSRGAA